MTLELKPNHQAADPAGRSFTDLIAAVGGPTVVLATSKDPNAKLSVLLFPPRGDRPRYVAKVPSTDGAVLRIDAEAAALRRLRRSELGMIRPTVPGVVAVVTHRDRPVLVTTALSGRTMLSRYHSRGHTRRPPRVIADFAAAGAWLDQLWKLTRHGWTDLAGMLEGLVGALGRRFSDDPEVTTDLAHLGQLAGRLAGSSTPCTVVHGDFWPGNLLVDGGMITGVVDWEAARFAANPVHDLTRFALAYSLYLDRHTKPGQTVAGHPDLRAGVWGAGIVYALDGDGWYPRLIRGFLERNLARLGIRPVHWRDVMLAELLVVAAEADDDAFARGHLMTYRRLSRLSEP